MDSIDDDLVLSKPNVAVELVEDAIKHLILDNADLYELKINVMKKEMEHNFDISLMQKVHLRRDFEVLEAKLYELPIIAAKDKIMRYQEVGRKLANGGAVTKTMEDLLKEDVEERGRLILEMMKVAKEKDNMSGNTSRYSQHAAHYRKKMEDRLNGAQPWKEMRDQNDRLVSDFLKWAHRNGHKDTPEALREFLKQREEEEADSKGSPDATMFDMPQHDGEVGYNDGSDAMEEFLKRERAQADCGEAMEAFMEDEPERKRRRFSSEYE